MQTSYSAAVLRKRKMLLFLPLLCFPFLTLIFWSLGGGKTEFSETKTDNNLTGLNLQLPDARLKDETSLNKLSYYKKADADSIKRAEQIRNDPFFKPEVLTTTDTTFTEVADTTSGKIYNRIAALDRELNRKNNADDWEDALKKSPGKSDLAGNSEINRLQTMMETLRDPEQQADPQMEQLSGMLDKIMDIQHPERVNDQLRMSSLQQGEKTFPVSTLNNPASVSLLLSEKQSSSKIDTIETPVFYSSTPHNAGAGANAIAAVIHETRTIVNGAVVKLRLLTDIYVNGNRLESGSFVYGFASLAGERLRVEIPSLRYETSILPVSLAVFDMDGLEGIAVPGSITRDASKESSDRIIQGLALNSLHPSVGAQAAGAGIEAAKNLISKKVKLVRVTVKAGYRILLKDKK